MKKTRLTPGRQKSQLQSAREIIKDGKILIKPESLKGRKQMDELIMVGQMDNTMDNTHESANRVYSVEGIAPTIPTMAGGNIQPKFLEVKPICLNSKGGRGGILELQPSVQDRVYSTEGTMTAIITSFQPSILEDKQICVMRGRNPDNPSDRTTGSPTEQRLDPNSEGVCNTLTSVQKDNLVLERIEKQAIETMLENDCEHGDTINPFNKTVDKSGVSPTITTRPEGMKTAILPVIDTDHSKQATKEGTIECKIERYRIRKLTPRECWRLMGYTDADFDKAEAVNSNTQLYKQAGNAIVKQVLMAIFKQMNIKGVTK